MRESVGEIETLNSKNQICEELKHKNADLIEKLRSSITTLNEDIIVLKQGKCSKFFGDLLPSSWRASSPNFSFV